MNTESLAGALQLQPGRAAPHNLRSSRSNWLAMLAPGRHATEIPVMLAGLYSLCGKSHQVCAELALAAALGDDNNASYDNRSVQIETAREHVRRIALDWPRLLLDDGTAGAGTSLDARWHQSFRRCPLFSQPGMIQSDLTPGPAMIDPLGQVRDWLEHEWLGVSAAHWLDQWDQDGGLWLRYWADQIDTGLGRLVKAGLCVAPQLSGGAAIAGSAPALGWTDNTAPQLFADLAAEAFATERFALEPVLDAAPAQTGTWTRHFDRGTPACLPHDLLGARLADLVRLCLPDAAGRSGAGWLAHGHCRTGPLQAVAWLEMARGVLIHAVQLDSNDAATARVVQCQVIAPTEWNFHPNGVVANHLAQLDPADPTINRQVGLLMAAFDPCVSFSISTDNAQNAVGSEGQQP